jgi:catechol 2,3-dioxygenase-like lactoylglutathione lyase family enzyme
MIQKIQKIGAISHITFAVRDLEKSARFFVDALDAKEIYSSGEQRFSLAKEKFLLIGGAWIALMEGGLGCEPKNRRGYDHVAFKTPEAAFDAYVERIRRWDVEIRAERSRVQGEGRSFYFYDFDGHLFELHTGTLQERLSRYSHTTF